MKVRELIDILIKLKEPESEVFFRTQENEFLLCDIRSVYRETQEKYNITTVILDEVE